MLKTNEIQYVFNSEEKTVVAFIENTEFDAVKDFLKAICLSDICVATIDFNSLSRKYRMQKKYVSIVKMDADSNLSFAAFKALAMRRLYHAYDKDYQRCIGNLRLHLEFSVEALKDRESIVENYLESYEAFKLRFRLMRSNHTSPNHKITNSPENSGKEQLDKIDEHKDENPKNASASKDIDFLKFAVDIIKDYFEETDDDTAINYTTVMYWVTQMALNKLISTNDIPKTCMADILTYINNNLPTIITAAFPESITIYDITFKNANVPVSICGITLKTVNDPIRIYGIKSKDRK